MENVIFRRDWDAEENLTPNPVIKHNNRKQKDINQLMSYFSEADKTRIIKKLFKRDTAQFESFMTEVNKKLNWHDAYSYIETEFKKTNKDILSKEARIMTDRIFQFFYPDDISIGI